MDLIKSLTTFIVIFIIFIVLPILSIIFISYISPGHIGIMVCNGKNETKELSPGFHYDPINCRIYKRMTRETLRNIYGYTR